jgi:hypothetical protein
MEAIEHLRAAGLNEPAENLQKMAHEMRAHLERERRDSGSPESHRPSGPPAERLEEMQKQIRNLSSQVQDLRNMMQKRDGDHQSGNAGEPRRRSDGPPRPEQHSRDRDGHHTDKQEGPSPNNPPGEPRNPSRPEDAKRDGLPRDGAGKTPQPPAPGDEAKEGARAESSSRRTPPPSEQDRARFMGLSDQGREKFVKEMRESRDKMMNSSPEERMKWAKALFEKIEAEDKLKRDKTGSAEDALRALQVKPPF